MQRSLTRGVIRAGVVSAVALVLTISSAAAFGAEETPTQPDQQLAEGRVVYEANCAGCHQLDGSGLVGPALVDNPAIDDPGYVEDVVRMGRLDAGMPAFPALDDAKVAALVAYVQEGLGAPAPPPPPTDGDTGGTAGTELPFGVVVTYGLGLMLAAIAAVVVIGPILLQRREEAGKEFTAGQAWLKSLVIVVYFIVATVIVPSAVIESGFLAEPPSVYRDLFSSSTWRTIRDLIGAGVWMGALGLGFWLMRRAQRDRVI